MRFGSFGLRFIASADKDLSRRASISVGVLKTVSANGSRGIRCFGETVVELQFGLDLGLGNSPSNVTSRTGSDRLNEYLNHEGLCVIVGRLKSASFCIGISLIGDLSLVGLVFTDVPRWDLGPPAELLGADRSAEWSAEWSAELVLLDLKSVSKSPNLDFV